MTERRFIGLFALCAFLISIDRIEQFQAPAKFTWEHEMFPTVS